MATPPEFYADENTVTRSVCRLLRGLGYILHTPAELYGSREAALGAEDEDWLPKVGQRGWTVLGRDLKIYERPGELEAYRRARVQVFLLPGEALAAELSRLVEVNLAQDVRHQRRPPGGFVASHQRWARALRHSRQAPAPRLEALAALLGASFRCLRCL